MSSGVGGITFDCHDPLLLARFWAEVTGYEIHSRSGPNEALLLPPYASLASIGFVKVPEPKSVKNRVHLDVIPDTTRDDEVERLERLGASIVDDRRAADGSGWVVMADPEANEFCVMRAHKERTA